MNYLIVGIILVIVGIFFYFPQLGTLFHAWSEDDNYPRIEKQLRTLAILCFCGGGLLSLIGILLFFFKN